MGSYVGGRRRGTSVERRGQWARAYIPDAIGHRSFSLCEATVRALDEAALAIAGFDRAIATVPNGSALAKLFLCVEAVASARLTGSTVAVDRVLRTHADLAPIAKGRANRVPVAVPALAVIEATTGLEAAFSVDALTRIHTMLFEGSADADYGGRLRRQSRRCAGNGALGGFVPPPGEHVGPLLEDLCTFANRNDVPAVLQAAIVYAQFRTIRPFLDGNARMARALVHAILRRRGLATHTVVPLSVVFGADANGYESALDDYRFEGDYESGSNAARVNDWVATFAHALRAATQRAGTFETALAMLVDRWETTLGQRRSDAASARLIHQLTERPIITIAEAQEMLESSKTGAGNGIAELVEAGILLKGTAHRRQRVFEARDIVDYCEDFVARSPLAGAPR